MQCSNILFNLTLLFFFIYYYRNDDETNSKHGDVDDNDDEPTETRSASVSEAKDGEDRPSSSGN